MPKIHCICFDLDGVLLDAKDIHYDALNKALEIYGESISEEEHFTRYDGFPTSRKLELLSLERGLPRVHHGQIKFLKQTYTERLVRALFQKNDVHEFALNKLYHEGYKLFLCSNAVRSTVDMFLELSGFSKYFFKTFSNEEVKFPKPDPSIYRGVLQMMHLPGSSTLVIEDNVKGVTAAKLAGCHVLEVKTPWQVTYQNIRDRIREIQGW